MEPSDGAIGGRFDRIEEARFELHFFDVDMVRR